MNIATFVVVGEGGDIEKRETVGDGKNGKANQELGHSLFSYAGGIGNLRRHHYFYK